MTRMKPLFTYLKQYYRSLDLKVFLATTLLVASLIVLNYTLGIERRLSSQSFFLERFAGFFFLYLFTFCTAYWIHFSIKKHFWPRGVNFYVLLILSAALFAFKIGSHRLSAPLTQSLNGPWNRYWQILLDWPIKALAISLVVWLIWRVFRLGEPVSGLSTRNFTARPYLILLLLMIPLLGFAATQADFLTMYPKIKAIAFMNKEVANPLPYNILYELSYGSDFFGIELFFRGFLVLAFVRFVGKDAILPMAAFYCTIHFGKPLLECISSYLGGIILGVIVYRTQSIWGGLITHLGIAWLMELAGWIGNK